MKKVPLLLIALLFTCTLMAQNEAKFGLKGGLNVSTLNYSSNVDAKWKTGINLGGLAHLHVSPAFSLQPEVYYSGQGAKIPYGSNDMTLNLSYINIPVLLQYNFSNGFRLQGGPQIGFLAGVSDKVNDTELNLYDTDDFKSVDISLPLGLSYLGYSGLGVDARYNIGLTHINDNGGANIKNNVFQIGAFYLFDHKHKAKSK